MNTWKTNWQSVAGISSRSYVCSYCGTSISSSQGWHGLNSNNIPKAWVYLCHFCTNATYFDQDQNQFPAPPFGGTVAHVTDEAVAKIYDESRNCMRVGAHTAAVLCCRKLLMHVAVSKGAAEGSSFLEYVQYLASNHFIPKDADKWVDHIRIKGNEANHEVVIVERREAERLIKFSEMLLKSIYEFPGELEDSGRTQ